MSHPPSPRPSSAPPTAPDDAPAAATDATADRMLEAARAGSNRAWAALLERLDPTCRQLAHLVLGGHAVDAALLSAYVRAYRARRRGPDDAAAFLLHHVWIACGHEVRRRQRRQDPAPGRRADRDDLRPRLGDDALGRAVADLRPEERAVWTLVERAELDPAVVALALGVDLRVVTTVAERVRSRLVPALETDAEGPDGAPDRSGPVEDGPEDDVAASEAGTAGDGAAAGADGEPGGDDGAADEAAAPPDGDVVDLTDEAVGDGHDPDGAAGEPTAAVDVTDDAGAGPDGGAATDADTGSLDPPPPHPDFWPELGRRLRAEREALPAAPPPPLPEPGDSPSLTPAKAPPVAMQKRAPRRARRRKPDEIDDLVDEVERQRPRRHWPSLLIRAAAILVVLAVLGVGVAALYRAASNARSPVRGETVSDVAARSMEVLDDAETWSASLELTRLDESAALVSSSHAVVASRNGSYRVQDATHGRLTTYDAGLSVVMDTVTGLPPRHDTGVAPGPPDPSAPREGMPLDDLAIAARTLAPLDDVEPEEDRLNGRDVLVLTGPLTEEIDLTYIVDASSLLPLRITWTANEATVRELRFADVELGVVAPAWSQELPAGTEATDLGFAQVRLTDVLARTELQPVTPDYLPDGFSFTGAAVHEGDRIASLRYARGPQELIITLRPSPVEAGRPWDDPFARTDEVTSSELVVEAGPFRGVTAEQVAGGWALPSVWGSDGDLAFTVAGDLTADELVRVTQSLRRS